MTRLRPATALRWNCIAIPFYALALRISFNRDAGPGMCNTPCPTGSIGRSPDSSGGDRAARPAPADRAGYLCARFGAVVGRVSAGADDLACGVGRRARRSAVAARLVAANRRVEEPQNQGTRHEAGFRGRIERVAQALRRRLRPRPARPRPSSASVPGSGTPFTIAPVSVTRPVRTASDQGAQCALGLAMGM